MNSVRFHLTILFVFLYMSSNSQTGYADTVQQSTETEECLACHSVLHPGLVESWKKSRHAQTLPMEALQKDKLERRISTETVDESLGNVTVGCYECHSLNTDQHQDAFEHNGYVINVVVSPNDCATCHPVERQQYSKNLMAFAHSNLVDNALYQDFMKTINNPYTFQDQELVIGEHDPLTANESCLYCHGTKVEVTGKTTKETDFGELEFPVLTGWPNQGVGRINPDESRGACTSCHPRHTFSIETARKPYTCSECHKGPDVPAYKVYVVSKHGNIFKSKEKEFEFNSVPWVIGKDFTAPTCATCHVSLLVTEDETVIAERTHQFNNRLAWRLFGVPYAHPHPVSADLSKVKNSMGLPIATELDAKPVAEHVITKAEQKQRNQNMKNICLTCHNSEWVDNHFIRLDNTIEKTNHVTVQGTQILAQVWQHKLAQGLPQKQNIFDEEIERMWTSIWLFHANSTRFASAMAGGGDYGVFANGRFQMTGQLIKMQTWLEREKKISENK